MISLTLKICLDCDKTYDDVQGYGHADEDPQGPPKLFGCVESRIGEVCLGKYGVALPPPWRFSSQDVPPFPESPFAFGGFPLQVQIHELE